MQIGLSSCSSPGSPLLCETPAQTKITHAKNVTRRFGEVALLLSQDESGSREAILGVVKNDTSLFEDCLAYSLKPSNCSFRAATVISCCWMRVKEGGVVSANRIVCAAVLQNTVDQNLHRGYWGGYTLSLTASANLSSR